MSLEQLNENIDRVILIEYFTQVEYDEDDDDEEAANKLPELLSYEIVSYDHMQVSIQLVFSNPLYVSSTSDKDFIAIDFVTNLLFMAKSDNHTLAEGYHINRVTVPP